MTRRQRLSAAPGQGPTSQGGPEPGTQPRAGEVPFLASQPELPAPTFSAEVVSGKKTNRVKLRSVGEARASGWINGCGACGRTGHTRKTCPIVPYRGPRPGYATGGNAASYALNRERGLCVDCGKPSKRLTRCNACTRRRSGWRSRTPEARAAEYTKRRRS